MKILLDECVTRKAKRFLVEHEVYTVYEMNFGGLKNGALLSAAERENFDILLTIDKNIDAQQNIKKYRVTIVILDVLKSNLKYIEELIPKFKEQMDSFEPGNAYKINR